mgnify:FL=1
MAFAEREVRLQKSAARAIDDRCNAIGTGVALFTPRECRNDCQRQGMTSKERKML